jgi:hypothetical protein
MSTDAGLPARGILVELALGSKQQRRIAERLYQ